jgi:hypothetical protein
LDISILNRLFSISDYFIIFLSYFVYASDRYHYDYSVYFTIEPVSLSVISIFRKSSNLQIIFLVIIYSESVIILGFEYTLSDIYIISSLNAIFSTSPDTNDFIDAFSEILVI